MSTACYWPEPPLCPATRVLRWSVCSSAKPGASGEGLRSCSQEVPSATHGVRPGSMISGSACQKLMDSAEPECGGKDALPRESYCSRNWVTIGIHAWIHTDPEFESASLYPPQCRLDLESRLIHDLTSSRQGGSHANDGREMMEWVPMGGERHDYPKHENAHVSSSDRGPSRSGKFARSY